MIALAAQRQIAHVKGFAIGPYGELSQEILNELARARTAYVSRRKARYDAALRVTLQDAAPALSDGSADSLRSWMIGSGRVRRGGRRPLDLRVTIAVWWKRRRGFSWRTSAPSAAPILAGGAWSLAWRFVRRMTSASAKTSPCLGPRRSRDPTSALCGRPRRTTTSSSIIR